MNPTDKEIHEMGERIKWRIFQELLSAATTDKARWRLWWYWYIVPALIQELKRRDKADARARHGKTDCWGITSGKVRRRE